MKTVIILFAAALLCSTPVFSQKLTEDKIPAEVKAAFKAKFPKVTTVSWEMEDQKEYEASFKLDKTDYTASFDLKGKWLETENVIEIAKLPKLVSDVVSKEYAGYSIKLAEQNVSAKGTTYELSLLKGMDKKSVLISDKGIVLKKEVEKDEEGKK
jgi:hypothetical protein